MTIAGKSFVVTEQAATCTYTVAPLTVTVPPGGATGTISVTTLSTCAWTSSSGTSWISLTGAGTGSGTASYTIGANTGTASRTATVTVAGVAVRFDQNALTPRPRHRTCESSVNRITATRGSRFASRRYLINPFTSDPAGWKKLEHNFHSVPSYTAVT